jgi:hypothetical protein
MILVIHIRWIWKGLTHNFGIALSFGDSGKLWRRSKAVEEVRGSGGG